MRKTKVSRAWERIFGGGDVVEGHNLDFDWLFFSAVLFKSPSLALHVVYKWPRYQIQLGSLYNKLFLFLQGYTQSFVLSDISHNTHQFLFILCEMQGLQ